MTPRAEFADLVARSRALVNAALLMVITAALLVVALGILFCTTFTTVFVMARNTIDRKTARVTVEKGAVLHAIP